MIQDAIQMLVDGESLSAEQAAAAMNEIMTGEATPAQVGSFLTALRVKGETVDEITGMARVMREKSLHVSVEGPVVDTCGTGGDGSGSFNISTTGRFRRRRGRSGGGQARQSRHVRLDRLRRRPRSPRSQDSPLPGVGSAVSERGRGSASCSPRATIPRCASLPDPEGR